MTAPIVVSMGDPAGIGLEIAAKAIDQKAENTPGFVLIGDEEAFQRAAARCGRSIATRRIAHLSEARGEGPLEVLHAPLPAIETPGAPDQAHAPAIIGAIELGVRACLAGDARALVTLPIAKAPLQAAGFGFPGHTEFIAHLCKDTAWPQARGPVMMLAAQDLRVSLATIHTPLRSVPSALTRESVEKAARVTLEALQRDFGIANPRLALAGLNPHAGEDGTIGREEIEVINPVAAKLRAEGFLVTDARSADALFHEDARRSYDAALALYHDQGLIPIKTLDFWGAVNVTLGLPLIRTSPDHGVAFDIAGANKARPDSFRAALRLADAMAEARARP